MVFGIFKVVLVFFKVIFIEVKVGVIFNIYRLLKDFESILVFNILFMLILLELDCKLIFEIVFNL